MQNYQNSILEQIRAKAAARKETDAISSTETPFDDGTNFSSIQAPQAKSYSELAKDIGADAGSGAQNLRTENIPGIMASGVMNPVYARQAGAEMWAKKLQEQGIQHGMPGMQQGASQQMGAGMQTGDGGVMQNGMVQSQKRRIEAPEISKDMRRELDRIIETTITKGDGGMTYLKGFFSLKGEDIDAFDTNMYYYGDKSVGFAVGKTIEDKMLNGDYGDTPEEALTNVVKQLGIPFGYMEVNDGEGGMEEAADVIKRFIAGSVNESIERAQENLQKDQEAAGDASWAERTFNTVSSIFREDSFKRLGNAVAEIYGTSTVGKDLTIANKDMLLGKYIESVVHPEDLKEFKQRGSDATGLRYIDHIEATDKSTYLKMIEDFENIYSIDEGESLHRILAPEDFKSKADLYWEAGSGLLNTALAAGIAVSAVSTGGSSLAFLGATTAGLNTNMGQKYAAPIVGGAFGAVGSAIGAIPGIKEYKEKLSPQYQQEFDMYVGGMVIGMAGMIKVKGMKNMNQFVKHNFNPKTIINNFNQYMGFRQPASKVIAKADKTSVASKGALSRTQKIASKGFDENVLIQNLKDGADGTVSTKQIKNLGKTIDKMQEVKSAGKDTILLQDVENKIKHVVGNEAKAIMEEIRKDTGVSEGFKKGVLNRTGGGTIAERGAEYANKVQSDAVNNFMKSKNSKNIRDLENIRHSTKEAFDTYEVSKAGVSPDATSKMSKAMEKTRKNSIDGKLDYASDIGKLDRRVIESTLHDTVKSMENATTVGNLRMIQKRLNDASESLTDGVRNSKLNPFKSFIKDIDDAIAKVDNKWLGTKGDYTMLSKQTDALKNAFGKKFVRADGSINTSELLKGIKKGTKGGFDDAVIKKLKDAGLQNVVDFIDEFGNISKQLDNDIKISQITEKDIRTGLNTGDFSKLEQFYAGKHLDSLKRTAKSLKAIKDTAAATKSKETVLMYRMAFSYLGNFIGGAIGGGGVVGKTLGMITTWFGADKLKAFGEIRKIKGYSQKIAEFVSLRGGKTLANVVGEQNVPKTASVLKGARDALESFNNKMIDAGLLDKAGKIPKPTQQVAIRNVLEQMSEEEKNSIKNFFDVVYKFKHNIFDIKKEDGSTKKPKIGTIPGVKK